MSDTAPTVRPRDVDDATDDEIAPTPNLTTRGHPDDTEWKKHTTDLWARVEGGLVGFALDGRDDAADLKGFYEIQPSGPDTVCLSFHVEGVFRGADTTIAGTQDLTPKQAEGLAAALLEAAEQARNGGVDG
jgi:hypothetical protein